MQTSTPLPQIQGTVPSAGGPSALLERRRSSEEYAAAMRLHAFSEINQMLAKKNNAREEELRREFEAKREAARHPNRPVFRSVLSSPSAIYPAGLRRAGPSAYDSMEEIPLVGTIRRRSTPGVLTMPQPLSPSAMGHSRRGSRTPRHYFDLTPGHSNRASPNGDMFTPMEPPATVVEEEPVTMREKCAMVAVVLGMAALAMPIVILVGKAIQHNIDKLRGN